MSSPSCLLPALSPSVSLSYALFFTSIPSVHSLVIIQDPNLSSLSWLDATLTRSIVSPTEVLHVKAVDGQGRGLCCGRSHGSDWGHTAGEPPPPREPTPRCCSTINNRSPDVPGKSSSQLFSRLSQTGFPAWLPYPPASAHNARLPGPSAPRGRSAPGPSPLRSPHLSGLAPARDAPLRARSAASPPAEAAAAT